MLGKPDRVGRLVVTALLVVTCGMAQGSTYSTSVTRAARTGRPALSRAARAAAFKATLVVKPKPIVYPVVGYHTKSASDAFWRPLVIGELKTQKIYSADNLYHALNVIWGESRGNTKAHTAGTQYYGLVQFGTDWVSKSGSSSYVSPNDYGTSRDWRMNGATSLRRLVKSVREGGHGMWTKHWGQTCG
jgi:hypothetical protein